MRASNGGRPTPCAAVRGSKASMPSRASSARCSFPTRCRATGKRAACCKPGGRFFFNVWDRISENEFADVVTQALAELFPHDPPRFLARTPHGYHDADRIRAELNAAGFADVSIEAVEHAAGPPRRAIRRSPIARARRFATRSKRATLRACKRRRSTRPRRWRGALAAVRSMGVSARWSLPPRVEAIGYALPVDAVRPPSTTISVPVT